MFGVILVMQKTLSSFYLTNLISKCILVILVVPYVGIKLYFV